MPRKICVVTTSRADFGPLSSVMCSIRDDPALRLQVIVSGMHLMPSFGNTWREIEQSHLRINARVPMPMAGKSPLDNLKAMGTGLRGFSDSLAELKPHILVLLGDRTEILMPALAALVLGVPVAHIHGGELTEGAIDDSIRHAVTKLASLHFAATEDYRRRIIQMGESPHRVFNVGAPGLDQIYASTPLSRTELEEQIRFSLEPPVALITWHPVTRVSSADCGAQLQRFIRAVKTSGVRAVITAANSDANGNRINNQLRKLCSTFPERFHWAPHLGHQRYLSCLAHCSVMIGNSSSGLTEAPSFRLPVVNIGDRQRGRVRAANVIDVACDEHAILRGIRRALSPAFRRSLAGMQNPYDRYGDGRTGERIRNVLRDVSLDREFLRKEFHDLRK